MMPGRWALNYSTGAQEEFWGPGVLPLPGFSIAPYPAPPGAFETSQMGCTLNFRIKRCPTTRNSEREYPNSDQHPIWQC